MEALSFYETSLTMYHSKGHNNTDTWNFNNTAARTKDLVVLGFIALYRNLTTVLVTTYQASLITQNTTN
jgi:hypothetical protein